MKHCTVLPIPSIAHHLLRNSNHAPYRQHLTTLRALSTTAASPLSTTTLSSKPTISPPTTDAPESLALIYQGPLAPTFKRLKIFSLSSLTLSFLLSPFIFIIESGLPLSARAALAGIAIGTSGVSTALVSWCGQPYVTAMHRGAADGVLELTTLTLALHSRVTRVYDPAFLEDATRPFARWSLASAVQLPSGEARMPAVGSEETVSETTDAKGNVLGRWVVTWAENGEGNCRAVGQVVRHFNVHEELLDTPVR
ncbi:hypothetical protein HETIRDRAFT_412753 [Heterobasidion irregulare TC 32-1]|uniref:Uncharacterized protein n=1 Tax=Heterobasidion irregulare (strain TC 32-1) TaxID=747525 RepID=W4JMZ5_HETIT|nr:uncharacterized protein HETIRDRAFT_412753 [Heterobasidion irregulare TC 32-1]ETW74834.1 hypothetical protein HETIRDRAFT_412753 [Heterobasidion irregulare TC 32-1]